MVHRPTAAQSFSLLHQQNIVFLGSRPAGCSIASKIKKLMIAERLSPEQARSNIYMIDRMGLLTDDQPD